MHRNTDAILLCEFSGVIVKLYIVLDRYPEVINFFHEHSVEVVSKIATTFISIRLKHFAKQENERIKRSRLRKKLSKLVLLNNQ